MAIKITDIRNKHEFMSDAEKAAAFQEAVAAKVAELKSAYSGNPKFAKFTEDDWLSYAAACLKKSNAITTQSYYYGVPGVELDPELAMWVQYTYEEILQMEAGGVLIPEEILAWAHSMQDNDVTSYEVGEESSSAEETVDESDDSDLSKLEKDARKMGEKAKQANEETNVKYAEFETISKKAEDIKREQEASQKDGLKEIQELTEEYAKLDEKIRRGDQLNEAEKNRYRELNSLLNGKDGELVTDIQASTAELEDLMNSMKTLDKDIDTNIELGDDAIRSATKLAEYEKEHKSTNVEGNFFINMATGQTLDEFYGAKGQSLARDVFDSGNNLIQFSNTLNTTLMSNEYTALLEFATQFSANANETLDGTKEAMGENFNKSTEELNGEETNTETPADEEAEEQLTMKDLTTLGFGSKELIKKDIEVREASQKVAEQAEQEVETHKNEQEKLQKEKDTVQEEQEDAAKDVAGSGSNPEIEEDPEIDEPQDLEDAQETQETQKSENEEKVDKQSENEKKAEKVLDINAAIEASNLEGDTAKERLEKATEVNDKYKTFNDEAADIMDKTCNVGAAATVFGTGMIANGSSLIVAGVPLLPNPFTHAMGAMLIAQGVILTTAGTGFLGIGGSLIAIGLNGVDETMLTGDQIDLTDEIVQDAMAQIEGTEGAEGAEGQQGRSAAEQERFDMRKAGASLPDQARHFRKKSSEETLKSAIGIVETKFVEEKSEKEAKTAEGIAEGIEKRLSGKKEEYDKLKEKKEKFDEQQEKLANASSPEDYKNMKIDPAEQFTSFDQQKMTMLGNQLQMFGDTAQAKLFQSLEKVEGLAEFLEDKEEIALTAIDYGQVAQIVGMQLFDQSKNNVLLITRMLLGLTTMVAGKGAETVGGTLKKVVDKADTANESNINTITGAQQTVENITMSKAITSNEGEEGEEEDTENKENKEGEEEQPKLTEGQSKLKKMQAEGKSLPEQTAAFMVASGKEGAEAEASMMMTQMVEAESNKEAKTAEFIAKVVEKTMKDKKEEYDELTEKKEKAKEAEKKAKERAEAAKSRDISANPTAIENPEEEFTEEDEQRLNKLSGQLERVGDSAQGRLLKSLEKVEGLDEFLADFGEEALEAMDYGAISEILGMILFEQTAGNIFLIHHMLLGLLAMRTGKNAQISGEELGEAVGKTYTVNASNTTKIHQSQQKVAEVTMSEALGGSTESAEEQENTESTEGAEGANQSAVPEETPETTSAEEPPAGENTEETPPVAEDLTSTPAIAVGDQTSSEQVAIATASSQATSQSVAMPTPTTEDGTSIEAPAISVGTTKTTSQTVATGTTVADSVDETGATSVSANAGAPQGSGLTGAAAMVAGFNKAEFVEKAQAKVGMEGASGSENSESAGGTEKDQQAEDEQSITSLIAAQGDNAQKTQQGTDDSKAATADAKVANKDSKELTKDAKKDEKQLTAEGKNIEKMIQQEQKEVEKLVEESQAAVEEQLQLIAEFETLQGQTDTLNAKVEASNSQQQAPAPQSVAPAAAEGAEGGGLLAAAPQAQPQMQDTSIQQDIVTISANQARMGEISTRFNVLGVKIDTNRVKMTKTQGSINRRIRKYKKVTDARIKMQKAAQKAEEKKQKQMQKTMAALDIVSSVFSIVSAISSLMQVLGIQFITIGGVMIATGTPLLSNPFTAAAGAALVAGGTAMETTGGTSEGGGIALNAYCAVGIAACQVAKAGVLLANGYSKEAFMTLATAAISIATSMVGAGGAASGALQGISAGCQIVGSSAQLAANVQTVQGKEQSAWLGTVSQVAGLAGGLAGAGAGLSGGVQGFEGAVKVIGAAGQAASATAQISTWIKQANGKDAGKFEEIMGLIGTGLSTASAVMSLGMQAFGGSGNTDNNKGSDDANNDPKTDPKGPETPANNNGTEQPDATENPSDPANKPETDSPEGKKDTTSTDKKEEVKKADGESDEEKKEEVTPAEETALASEDSITGAAADIVKAEQAQTSVKESIQQVDSAATQVESQDQSTVDALENYNADSDNQNQDLQTGSDNQSTDNTEDITNQEEVGDTPLATEEEQQEVEEVVPTEEVVAEEELNPTEEEALVENSDEEESDTEVKDESASTELAENDDGTLVGAAAGVNDVEQMQTEISQSADQLGASTEQVESQDPSAVEDIENYNASTEGTQEQNPQSDDETPLTSPTEETVATPLATEEGQSAAEEVVPTEEGTELEGQKVNAEEKPNTENVEGENDNEQKAEEVGQQEKAKKAKEEKEPKLTRKERKAQEAAEEQEFAEDVKERNGFTEENKSQTIDGQTFEINEEGNFVINGEEVSPGEMHARMTAAKAEAGETQQEFDNLEAGGVKEIDGNMFEKQEDGSYKLVKGYDDDMNRQLSDETFDAGELFETTQMTEEQRTQWQQENVDPIRNAQNTPSDNPTGLENTSSIEQRVAEHNGLEIGKKQTIGGQTFEVTTDGKYMVDGQEVDVGTFLLDAEAANNYSTSVKEQFDTAQVGDSQTIDGNEFVKQEDGTYKFVTGFDENLEMQLADKSFDADELYNISMGTKEQRAQWADSELAEFRQDSGMEASVVTATDTIDQTAPLEQRVARQSGLEIGKKQTIGGQTFEVTADGKYMVDGKEVDVGTFVMDVDSANAYSATIREQFDNAQVGDSQTIDDNRFIKQEDGTYKLVTGYDDNLQAQLADKVFGSDELYNMGMSTPEERAQWQQENIDPITNPSGEATANNSELSADSPALSPEQKQLQQAKQIAEQSGLKLGKSQTVDGHSFEVTKSGECLIDGQKVHPGEMKDRITVAKANSDKMQQQLADCKVGESQFVNGTEFVKQKDGTFKMVSEYDQDFKQQTLRREYSAEEVLEVGNMSQNDVLAWADKQIKNENVATGFEKTVEILGKVGELASGGSQMAATIENLTKDDSVKKREVLHLSNMKKGKALMKKIKRKQHVAGHNPYK
ncbi:MAG: hypothetical protein E7Z93_04525 [Cyanobacteria bacterium SIG32]|nr:hypothetical protein [Cyanobacteria bacterium SIG32]